LSWIVGSQPDNDNGLWHGAGIRKAMQQVFSRRVNDTINFIGGIRSLYKLNIDVKVLAQGNLAVQTLLMGVLSVAAYNSLIKRDFKKHCAILRIAVPVQILAITLVMLPSLLGYLINERKGVLFDSEILLHHTLGLVVIAVWIYANLVLLKKIKSRIPLKKVMRLGLVSWIITYSAGVYLYLKIYGL
jgi:hypothetical protein